MSVVIPTFNRARYLPDAIRSVLDQSHGNLELIVVDDGSTDDTPVILDGFVDERLQVIRIDRSRSPARARNVGIARASGQFLAFLDSDDIWLPTKLEQQIAALRASSDCRWSYTLFDHIDEDGVPMAPLRGGVGNPRSGWILNSIVTEGALVMVQSVLAEASLVREAGGFDEAPEIREDLDLCFRLAMRSQACAVDQDLVRIRHHPGRTTFELAEVRLWRVRALRKLSRSHSDPVVRRLCRRECAREMVDLARVYSGSGRSGSALVALAGVFPYRPLQPGLWTTLAKALVRPLATRRMLETYRRLRDRNPSRSRTPQGRHRAAGRDSRTEMCLELSVLGIPISLETNSAQVLELARAAYGEASTMAHRGSLRVRITEDAGLTDPPAVPPVVHLPDPDRLVLQFGDGHGSADAGRGFATAHVSPMSAAAPGFRERVLDHLILFLVTRADRCPVHAGAIARDGRALLLAGPSGLGKSSLTYAAMRQGFQVLADDVVYVQRHPHLQLWSMPRRIHLPTGATRHFSELEGSEEKIRPDGRSKISVAIPAAARAHTPWIGNVGLCILSPSSMEEPAEQLSPEAAVVEMRATLQGGFRRFSEVIDDCVRVLAEGGCWRVPVTADPQSLLSRVEAVYWVPRTPPSAQ